jgi:hypothetical protein
MRFASEQKVVGAAGQVVFVLLGEPLDRDAVPVDRARPQALERSVLVAVGGQEGKGNSAAFKG